MLVSDVISRLKDKSAAFADRVEGAAELSELIRRKALPQAPFFAWVLPLGLNPLDRGTASTGFFIQNVDEAFAIVIFVRAAGDVTGVKSLPTIDVLVWQEIMPALAGWSPEGAMGVFSLRRGQLLSAEAGAVIYQLDFAVQQQVRII